MPYYPALCDLYLLRFVDIVKHRKRLQFWDPDNAASELEKWKQTEQALTQLLLDFIVAVDMEDQGRRTVPVQIPTMTPVPSEREVVREVALTPPREPSPQLPAPAPAPPTPVHVAPVTPLPEVDEHRTLRVALLATAEKDATTDPNRPSIRQAITGPNSSAWLGLIKGEMQHLSAIHSWDLVDWASPAMAMVREKRQLLVPQFICKVSPGEAGILRQVHLSARQLAPNGQPAYMSLRTMLAVYAQRTSDLSLVQFDYINPFLHEGIEDDIYLAQPPGMAVHPLEMAEPVFKLQRALYGVEGSNPWSLKMQAALLSLGFQSIEGNEGMYLHTSLHVVMGVYVDELVCLGTAGEVHLVEDLLRDLLHVRNARPLRRLGSLEIHADDHQIRLNQEGEILRLLTRLGVEGAEVPSLPLPLTPVSSRETEDFFIAEPPLSLTKQQWYTYTYTKLKGLAHATRPDIAYTLLRLSPRVHPILGREDYAALWRLLFYIKRTAGASLTFGAYNHLDGLHHPPTTSTGTLVVHVAAAPAPVVPPEGGHHYVGGAVLYLGSAPVHWYWSFLKDDPVDSTEASYINAAQAVFMTTHLRHLLAALTPDVHHGPRLGGRMPQLYLSNPEGVAQLLSPEPRAGFSSDAKVGKCYRYVRSRIFPVSLDRFLDLNETSPNMPSLARGLVNRLEREEYLAWRHTVRVLTAE